MPIKPQTPALAFAGAPPRGPAGEIRRSSSDATLVDLTYDNKTTSLENIDTQVFMRKVIHEVQTEYSVMRRFVTTTILNGTFEWRNLTPKRDPVARQNVIPDLNPRKQTFSTFGITVNPYDDDCWLPQYTTKNSRIQFEASIVKAMEMGFERLYDKMAFNAMLVPVRTRTTSGWKEGTVATQVALLPNDRIGGNITGTGGAAKLADPTFDTLVEVGLKFYNNNVMRGTKIYAALTPNMQRILWKLLEFRNKDYIFAMENIAVKKTIPFANFEWVSVTPEVSPGAYYSDKWLVTTTAGLAEATDASGGNALDLTDSNHEVIPFWIKSNVFVGECPALDQFSIFTVPYKRQTPIVVRTKWLGASRAQNKLQYNLIVPTS